jgi:predicted nucleic acid-binding protein
MIGVVDTSALIRLFVPDGPVPQGLEAFFRKVAMGLGRALAPELLAAEAANVILKKLQRGELAMDEARSLLKDVMVMPIELRPHMPLLESAFILASEQKLSAYDALFLALALEQNATFYTADDQLAGAAEVLHLTVNR